MKSRTIHDTDRKISIRGAGCHTYKTKLKLDKEAGGGFYCDEVLQEVFQHVLQEVFQEVFQDVFQEIVREVFQKVFQKGISIGISRDNSRGIPGGISRRFQEISQEAFQNAFQDIFQEIVREVFQEVFHEVFRKVEWLKIPMQKLSISYLWEHFLVPEHQIPIWLVFVLGFNVRDGLAEHCFFMMQLKIH